MNNKLLIEVLKGLDFKANPDIKDSYRRLLPNEIMLSVDILKNKDIYILASFKILNIYVLFEKGDKTNPLNEISTKEEMRDILIESFIHLQQEALKSMVFNFNLN